ncbi:hypothetical protein IRT38_00955 (plasmid) [Acinetobacter sp. SK-43]|uniref:hypothetical protein n=1 Tax=Acinetobacter sp. SK-43 TaxID=2785295 RepID=UPI00188BD022|nr:hypothetical protein [Acinetobacter sp. SK-43]MBF4453985.1 hypothetical protein [Acinetobacter sp. SK-43]
MNKHLSNAVEFLQAQGLEINIGLKSENTFLPNIEIVNGAIHYDPDCTLVSDLLHESGHVMLCPKPFRKHLHNNLYKGFRYIFETVSIPLDSQLHWYLMAMDDHGVTAWAWAVGKHLGIPDHEIIKDDQYGGEGASIRTCLQLNSYIGINGLSHAKYCDMPNTSRYKENAIVFPNMKKWSPSYVE